MSISSPALWNLLPSTVMSVGSQINSQKSDEELASQWQATGDPDLFREIFARHRRLVFCACRRFFEVTSLAEDATQETFLRAYLGLKSFQQGNLQGWLLRIARNVCIDLWRKQRPEIAEGAADCEGHAAPENPEESARWNRLMERLWDEMKHLSPEQRHCLELKIDGYSYEETAERTGLTVKAVKSHLQNGRRLLWLRLERPLSELL